MHITYDAHNLILKKLKQNPISWLLQPDQSQPSFFPSSYVRIRISTVFRTTEKNDFLGLLLSKPQSLKIKVESDKISGPTTAVVPYQTVSKKTIWSLAY